MGYYSSYSLEVTGQNGQVDNTLEVHEIIEAFRDKYDGAMYCLDKTGDSNEQGKWYSAEEDLVEFSKEYPTALFFLDVEGEENGDLWHLYVVNGKKQVCKAEVVYPPFEPCKLR